MRLRLCGTFLYTVLYEVIDQTEPRGGNITDRFPQRAAYRGKRVVDSQIKISGRGILEKLFSLYRAFVSACCSRVDVRLLETPLYQRIYDDIKRSVDKGEYAPGSRIPTEVELAERYSVSRITVRRAIEDLSTAGILVKRRGLGTFVCAPRMRRKLLQGGLPESFTQICEKSGRVPGAKLIDREIVVPRPDEKEFFELGDDDLVLHIQRVRTADGQPVFEENMYLPYSSNKELATLELGGESIYGLMGGLYGRRPVKNARVLVESVGASSTRAMRLQISAGEPMLYITTYALDQNDEPIYIGRQYFIGSRYMLDL